MIVAHVFVVMVEIVVGGGEVGEGDVLGQEAMSVSNTVPQRPWQTVGQAV